MAQAKVDERPVVMGIFADDCARCTDMKRDPTENWNSISEALNSTGRFRVEQTTLKAMRNPVDPKWPQDLNRYHKFYPAILLLNGKSWNAAIANPSMEIHGTVYGGKVDPASGQLVPDKSRPYPRTRRAVVEWALLQTGGALTEAEIRTLSVGGQAASGRQPTQPVVSDVSAGGFDSVQDITRNDQFCQSKPEVYPARWQQWV